MLKVWIVRSFFLCLPTEGFRPQPTLHASGTPKKKSGSFSFLLALQANRPRVQRVIKWFLFGLFVQIVVKRMDFGFGALYGSGARMSKK